MTENKVIIDDKTIAVKNTEVKFGLGQITKPTPPIVTNIFRAVLYGVFVLNLVTMTFSEIPDDIADLIDKWSAETIVFAHGVSKLFGLNIDK